VVSPRDGGRRLETRPFFLRPDPPAKGPTDGGPATAS
jgi:hypothetical protein